MRKTKAEYPPGSGAMREAVSLDFDPTKEPWSEYELEDGSIIKARSVLTECIRVEGEYDAEGNPIYILKVNGVMSVIAPDKIKQKKKQ